MPAVAVTDTNNLFGAMEFAGLAAKGGVQPIIGAQLDLNVLEKQRMGPLQEPDLKQIVLLAQNETGYQNLLKLVSSAYLGVAEGEAPHITRHWLAQHSEGLILLTGGLNGPLSQLILKGKEDEAEEILRFFLDVCPGRTYVELQRHQWADEDKVEGTLIDLAYKHNVPLVATNDCFFTDREMFEAHDVLIANAQGTTIADDARRRMTPEHYFKSAAEMRELFKDVPEAIDNTLIIAQRCAFMPESREPLLPPFTTGDVSGASNEAISAAEIEELKKQAKDGLDQLLEAHIYTPEMDATTRKEVAQPYYERMETELDIIASMGFAGYFLIVSDFMKWCVDHDLPIGPGRGSGAGSVVAWSLKITNLDPLRWGLLFERFLNPERVSMPDFDIDFCQERRDEVIRYVQDKYGHDKVAQIITFGKLQAKAVVRDVGRVLGMPYGQVDKIAKLIPNNPANPVTLQEAIDGDEELRRQQKEDEEVEKLLDIALKLEGLYRHASTHAAGVVIGDRPLDELIPLYRDPRSDMPVTQFDMKRVEYAGLVKFDFLGLKTLTVLKKAVELVKQHKGVELDLDALSLDDVATYEMLARGETTGVFQLESAGMRDVLKKLKIDRFEDIIAVVSLYRPGPMDNIPTFIRRRHGEEKVEYLHPKLEPILNETGGIMIYQEQVMQAAQELAGYTLGGADLLRRAMGKKIQAEMDKQRELFAAGAKEHNDVPQEKADEIFDQIAKFAGYGFNKSHAAAYALIAYHTAYLKANYPHEFLAASMTLDMGNTDKLNVFRQELERSGITMLPPCVNHSGVEFTLEGEGETTAVRYALGAIKGAGTVAMGCLVAERVANGAYQGAADIADRLDTKVLNKRQLEALCFAGAFDGLQASRASVHATIEPILARAHHVQEEKNSNQVSLFGGEDELSPVKFDWVPLSENGPKDWSHLEKLANEFTAIGSYLSAHPLDGYKAVLEHNSITQAGILPTKVETQARLDRVKMVGIVTAMKVRTSQKGNKYAFVNLSDPTGVYEIMVFSDTLYGARDLLDSNKPLLVSVDVQVNEDGYRLTCQSLQDLDLVADQFTPKMDIIVSDESKLETLLGFLQNEKKGRCAITLKVPANDHWVEMQLAQSYSLSADTLAFVDSLQAAEEMAKEQDREKDGEKDGEITQTEAAA